MFRTAVENRKALRSTCKVPDAVVRFLTNSEISREIFTNTEFHENPSSGSLNVPFGQIDECALKLVFPFLQQPTILSFLSL